jgi:hypothetical protein
VPAKRDPSLGSGVRARRTSTTNQARGATKPPANPTGRLVITAGGVVHWLPKEGTVWDCPECGSRFVRDEDRRGEPWRVIEQAAAGGRSA